MRHRRSLAWLGLCLPLLLAAAPDPAPDAPKPQQVEPKPQQVEPKPQQVEPKPQQVEPKPQQVERVPPEQALAILGRSVETPDGKTIGRLIDVLVDAAGVPEAAVIDFGGFMGVGARKIAVHWSALRFAPADPKRAITLALTLDQIKAAPEYKDTSKAAPVVVPATAQPASPAGTPVPAKTEPAPGSPAKAVQE